MTARFRIQLLSDPLQVYQAEANDSLLESALRAGIPMTSSCRNGTCRACLCRLVRGEVEYRIEWPGLSREEREQGWILPCVALPRSDLDIEAGRHD